MLVNLTKGLVVVRRVEFADSFLKRATGLMFRRSYDGALAFKIGGSAWFHGFFCMFPILLVCLKDNRVVCKKVLHPWRLERVFGDIVLELDARRDYPVEVGDEVVILEDSG